MVQTIVLWRHVISEGGHSSGITDEIVARSITVIGEAGSNAATLAATSDGFVQLAFRDLDGRLRVSLLMTPSGKPTLMFCNDEAARLKLGIIDGADGEEISLQLLDSGRKSIWRPSVSNPY